MCQSRYTERHRERAGRNGMSTEAIEKKHNLRKTKEEKEIILKPRKIEKKWESRELLEQNIKYFKPMGADEAVVTYVLVVKRA